MPVTAIAVWFLRHEGFRLPKRSFWITIGLLTILGFSLADLPTQLEPAKYERMVFGAKTFRQNVEMLGSKPGEPVGLDPWVARMRAMPATVVSSTLQGPFDWPDATVVPGDGVDIVARLKQESDVPLRSHGSLSLNWALMAAGLVDYVQVTIFPVISGTTGAEPIFQGAGDFDLELIESRTLDGRTQELTYRPTPHA